jgi:hypothetical protein
MVTATGLGRRRRAPSKYASPKRPRASYFPGLRSIDVMADPSIPAGASHVAAFAITDIQSGTWRRTFSRTNDSICVRIDAATCGNAIEAPISMFRENAASVRLADPINT